ncbi:hypothetical protein GGR56DRAFT_677421 [Xylariaceae sp. FL0804]|nr:hypothetical protein GGR56DRAFT_677421 [Xylariaceae sp. FL0804]
MASYGYLDGGAFADVRVPLPPSLDILQMDIIDRLLVDDRISHDEEMMALEGVTSEWNPEEEKEEEASKKNKKPCEGGKEPAVKQQEEVEKRRSRRRRRRRTAGDESDDLLSAGGRWPDRIKCHTMGSSLPRGCKNALYALSKPFGRKDSQSREVQERERELFSPVHVFVPHDIDLNGHPGICSATCRSEGRLARIVNELRCITTTVGSDWAHEFLCRTGLNPTSPDAEMYMVACRDAWMQAGCASIDFDGGSSKAFALSRAILDEFSYQGAISSIVFARVAAPRFARGNGSSRPFRQRGTSRAHRPEDEVRQTGAVSGSAFVPFRDPIPGVALGTPAISIVSPGGRAVPQLTLLHTIVELHEDEDSIRAAEGDPYSRIDGGVSPLSMAAAHDAAHDQNDGAEGEAANLDPFPFAPGSPKPDLDQDFFMLDRTALASVVRASDRGKHVMAKLIAGEGCNSEAMLSTIADFKNFGNQH